MPVSPAAQAAQLLAAQYGALVTGGVKTLPASTSGDIFTVTGGRVIVTSVQGVVGTAIQNQACTLSVGHKPTGGSSQVATLASASSIIAAASGTMLSVIASGFPAALSVVAPTSVLIGTKIGQVISSGGLCVVPAGTIQVTTSATNTGDVVWSLTYVPYDSGAVVTAA